MRYILQSIGCLLVLWVALASAVWPWRNPCSNKTGFLRHLPDALRFRALPKYQGNQSE